MSQIDIEVRGTAQGQLLDKRKLCLARQLRSFCGRGTHERLSELEKKVQPGAKMEGEELQELLDQVVDLLDEKPLLGLPPEARYDREEFKYGIIYLSGFLEDLRAASAALHALGKGHDFGGIEVEFK